MQRPNRKKLIFYKISLANSVIRLYVYSIKNHYTAKGEKNV